MTGETKPPKEVDKHAQDTPDDQGTESPESGDNDDQG